jgi:acetyl esterase/lipase
MTSRRALIVSAAISPVLASRAMAQELTPVQPVLEPDVVYGEVDGATLLLDVYHPPARETAGPAIVTIHGGGWTEGFGDRTMMVEVAQGLANAGYVVFNIAYRLLPEHLWPAQLHDVQRAVRWIRANAATYNVDPERIGSFGYSSGGHLAAFLGVRDTSDNNDIMLATFSSRVTCIAYVAGDVDLRIPYPDPAGNELIANLLGGTIDEVPGAYRDASPVTWVDGETVPFLIMQGALDESTPVEHARTMVEALHEAGVEVVYYEDPDADHGFQDPLAIANESAVWGLWANPGPWLLTFYGRHLQPDR